MSSADQNGENDQQSDMPANYSGSREFAPGSTWGAISIAPTPPASSGTDYEGVAADGSAEIDQPAATTSTTTSNPPTAVINAILANLPVPSPASSTATTTTTAASATAHAGLANAAEARRAAAAETERVLAERERLRRERMEVARVEAARARQQALRRQRWCRPDARCIRREEDEEDDEELGGKWEGGELSYEGRLELERQL